MPTFPRCGVSPVKPDFSFRAALPAALLALLLAAAWPQPAAAQSLAEALAMAYAGNPTLLAARAALRAEDERLVLERGPTVSAQGGLSYRWSENDLAGFDSTRLSDYSLRLTQPLFSTGDAARSSRIDNLIAAQRAGLSAAEQQVLLAAVTSYMDAILARAVLELAVSNEQRLQRQLEATEGRFRVGEVTRTDVSQARARHANARAELVRARGDRTIRAARFEEVIGARPATLSRPDGLADLPSSADEAIRIAHEEHPTVLQARAAERAARDDIDVELDELLPDLDLVTSYERGTSSSSPLGPQEDMTVQLRLTVPLYSSGFQHARIRAARQTATQRRLQIDEVRRRAGAAAVDAWQTLQTTLAQVEAFTEEVAANRVALEGTTREAEVGERTVLDILDAEQELFLSRINLAQAERDVVVASYRLQAALGRLTAERLRLPVALYDVEEHHRRTRAAWPPQDAWWWHRSYGDLLGGGADD